MLDFLRIDEPFGSCFSLTISYKNIYLKNFIENHFKKFPGRNLPDQDLRPTTCLLMERCKGYIQQ